MNSGLVFGVILGIIVIMLVWVTLGSKKKRWYKIYLANNDVMLLCRDLNERWWRSNGSYLRFKESDGHEVTFMSNGHWVIKMVSVPDNELELAKEEIKKIKEAQINGQC